MATPKHIGILAAVVFTLGVEGVTAASITEARLQELMGSTSVQAVSLETLRARDRAILEELARSLAGRYSDLLAGSEMIFTRMTDAGSVYYRLDFVGLRNRDHARALCEILEMERCIAKIGDDRLTVLDVRSDPSVAAIAVLEEATDPFDFLELEDPRPNPNPRAAEVEARVRGMLAPLGVYPEKRPDMDVAEEAPPAAAPVVPVQAEDIGEPEEQVGVYPLPRPFGERPASRPLDADLPQVAGYADDADYFDIALSDEVETVAMQPDAVAQVDGEDGEMREVAAVPPPRMTAAVAAPRVSRGLIQLPDATAFNPQSLKGSAIQMQRAQVVFEAPSEVSGSFREAAVIAPASLVKPAPPPPPVPLLRAAPLADLAQRLEATASRLALEAGVLAPKPLLREAALLALAPAPVAMTEIAELSLEAPVQADADILVAVQPDLEPVRAITPTLAVPVLEPSETALASISSETAAPVRREPATLAPMVVADALPQVDRAPAAEPAPPMPRMVVTAPEPEPAPLRAQLARMEPPVAAAEPAEIVARFSGEITRLGRVQFDDRFAQPSDVDFAGGRIAGRLQKLPLRRPDMAQLHSSVAPRVFHEGAPVAVSRSAAAPFDIAQVPGLPAPSAGEASEDAPFEMEQAPVQAAPTGTSALDRLLSEGDPTIQSMEIPDEPMPEAPRAEREAAPLPEAAPSRPVITASPAAEAQQAAPVAPRLPRLELSRDMQVAPPVRDVPQAQPVAPAAPAITQVQPAGSVDSDEARAMAVMREIMEGGDASAETTAAPQAQTPQVQQPQHQVYEQAYAPQAEPQPRDRVIRGAPMETSQRQPAPRGPVLGNTDASSAEEISARAYVHGDNRSPMARAANPLGLSSPQTGYRPEAVTARDLRVELSYVGSRAEVASRVTELRGFFPPVILDKGRFFGATIPEQPDRFIVGIAAHDITARDEIVWYLEQMGLPWAIR